MEAQDPPLSEEDLRGYLFVSRDPQHVLEEFVPLWDSLDLRLGRAFWKRRGANAFLHGEVPFGATCGGRLASDAADVLVTRWSELQLDEPVRLLEIGAGSGLFAKVLLDRLAEIAPEFYANCQFIVTDGVEAMLESIARHDILEAHAKQVRLATVDAGGSIRSQLESADLPTTGYFGIFANYLLDSLPFTIRAFRDQSAWEMQVRTSLADDLDERRQLDVERLGSQLAKLEEADDLAELHRDLVMDARYVPAPREEAVFPETLPAADQCSPDATLVSLDNYGAIEALDQLTNLLAPDGLLMIADYGQSAEPEPGEFIEYQRFGGSAAVGLNFAQVARWAEARDGVSISAPEVDPDTLLVRVVGRRPSVTLDQQVEELFSAERLTALSASLDVPRSLTKSRAIEAARWSYERAWRLQSSNWNVLEEIALFLLSAADDPDAALAAVTRSLEMNPTSAHAYLLMGQALWRKEEYERAEQAFCRGLELDPENVAIRLEMVQPLERRGDFAACLKLIGEALAIDRECEYRDELLLAQTNVLQTLTRLEKEDLIRSQNRLRRHRCLPG